MQWFKHDSTASNDAKLKRVRMKYGLEGYGLYWYCLELIAGEVSKDNITFELDHDAEIIAHDTGLHYERVQEMMTYMVNLGLFEENQGVISCIKMAQRLDKSMTSNPEMRLIIEGLRNPNNDSHDGVMIPSEKVMQDKIRLDKKRDSTPPAKPDDAQAIGKAKAIQILETFNKVKKEHGTNWVSISDPSMTSEARYKMAIARAKYVQKRLEKNGKPNDWPAILAWFERLYGNWAKDSFYSGHQSSARYPEGCKRSFESLHTESKFIDGLDRMVDDD